jgi:type I restriction enzyme, S subunit
MGLNWSRTKFSDFSIHHLIRGDYKYINFKKNVEIKYLHSVKLKDVISGYYKGYAFKGKDFSKDGEVFAIKGNIFNSDFSIDYDNASFLPIEHYEDSKYEKFKISKNDIIVSLVGSIGKMAIITNDTKALLNQNNIALQLDESKYNIKIFSYILKDKIKRLVESVYKNSGYSFLAIDDLFNLNLPKLSNDIQIELVKKIKPLEEEIKNLKKSQKKDIEIINEIFSQEFEFDSNTIKDLEREKTYKINFTDLNNSIDFRSATKFHSNKYDFLKLKIFTEYTFKDFAEFMTLGRQIKPEHFDKESDYFYLMPNAIKNNRLNEKLMKSIKFSFFDKLKHISLKYNDLVLAASGEGTIGKSAIYNSDIDAVTSQFIMKIELKNKELVNYFHYYMQSTFFQFTVEKFKKGMGNMTNIFVSQVKDFPVLFNKNLVSKIVDNIKKQIDEQKEIDRKIEQKQNEIKDLIQKAMDPKI